jgi:hypothetical protein
VIQPGLKLSCVGCHLQYNTQKIAKCYRQNRKKGGFFYMDVPKRGEERLCSIKYSLLAEWTGLSIQTVRCYSQRQHFDRRCVVSCLQWVNARRQRLGLPLVGEPCAAEAVLPEAVLPEPTTKEQAPPNRTGSSVSRPERFRVSTVPNGAYNPLTGSYDGQT